MTSLGLLLRAVFWSVATVGFYGLARRWHRLYPRRWTMPLLVTPFLLFLVMTALGASYHDYLRGTRWMLLVLGPATVAFAVPISLQRPLIQAHWRELLAATVVGSLTSIGSGWVLAGWLGLDAGVRHCLLPRSTSTPFALEVSQRLGSAAELTAVFVMLTGLLGTVIGDLLLLRFAEAPALARGALFGMGAHAAGTARAHQIGQVEGAVAGLVMVLVGLLNVTLAPLLAWAVG